MPDSSKQPDPNCFAIALQEGVRDSNPDKICELSSADISTRRLRQNYKLDVQTKLASNTRFASTERATLGSLSPQCLYLRSAVALKSPALLVCSLRRTDHLGSHMDERAGR